MSNEITETKTEILKFRYTKAKMRKLQQLQQTVLLSATKDIANAEERNLEIMRLSKKSKYSLSGIAREYLNKATEEWLPHEVMN